MLVEYQLKCRLPWFRYNKLPLDEIIKNPEAHDKLFCPEIPFCPENNLFQANNCGEIRIIYSNNNPLETIRFHAITLLSFISMCVGTVCQYEPWIIIDNEVFSDFFSFPKETSLPYKTHKDVKFWELCFGDIRDDFSSILNSLFNPTYPPISYHILPNYLATTYYIDFCGSLEWKFQNAVTTVESLMSFINKETYEKTEEEYLNKFNFVKANIDKEYISCISCRRITLEKKLADAIELGRKKLNVAFVSNFHKNKFSTTCANTRNHLCHYLCENKNKAYLSLREMSEATDFFITLARILVLSEICKNIDITTIFKQNSVLRLFLKFYKF